MASSNTTTSQGLIKVKHQERVKRHPYPKTTIKEFLEVLRVDFKINASATLDLLYDNEELSASCTLGQLGIPDSSELVLKMTSSTNNSLSIRVQTISGDIYSFRFDETATLGDLYDCIVTKIDFKITYPLLFNHRMHIFRSNSFLTEPLRHFLPLTVIQDENIPHFYLFEYGTAGRAGQYKYVKNLRRIFTKSDLWQPQSTKQSNEAMMIYLNTMYALIQVFLTKKDVDFDSVHNVYMPQFLIVLRRYLFPPACLAFKHVMEGALFNFEKSLLSEAFFVLFRDLLPSNVPDSELFSYTPYVFCWILNNADHTSTESACYESVEFYRRAYQPAGIGAAEASDVHFVKPVRLLNGKVIQSATNRFVLIEDEEARGKHRLSEGDFQAQPDLVGLLISLKNYGNTNNSDASSTPKDLFEQFSTYYTIWLPDPKLDLLSIGNVSVQKENLRRFSEVEMEEIKKQLSTYDLLSIFTFADPSALSKYTHAQLALLDDGDIVYITNIAKSNENSFLCFDPSKKRTDIDKTAVATKEVLTQQKHFIIRENAADIRKIEQITYILFDISGSMNVVVGNEDKKNTLLELSTMAFGAWRDRLVSYRLAHAIGLIYFGADDEILPGRLSGMFMNHRWRFGSAGTADRVVVRCDLTRDFTSFDKALGQQPECGTDTPLYDAIDMAVNKIRLFRENMQSRLSPTCRELILCLTDGADTCSNVSRAVVLEKLLSNNIVFDAISFEASPNEVLVEFCEKSKGYYYTGIEHNQESLLNLFELEAAISVQDREENLCGKVTRPQRRQSKYLDQPAIATKQAKIGDGQVSNITLRRIMMEIKNLNKSEQLSNFELFVSKENLLFWKVILHGETGTPYSDGRWLLFIEFPQMYPHQPPEIRFITKIYHCNINDDGKICHDVLSSAWSQKTSMHSVFMEILRLLREPNADDALSSVKGAQLKASKENYDNTIIEWKKLYAGASVEQLKVQYHLE